MMEESLAGQLLLAAPSLRDPNFARTVVLIGVHNDEGAMGVVLNRPSSVTVGEAVPQLAAGGRGGRAASTWAAPCSRRAVVCLAEFSDPACAELIVLGRIGFPAAEADVEELTRATERRRVFAGYAGWGEGQLDAEIERGDWIADPAMPEDVFSDDPEALWSERAERKGGSYALLARMPADPSLN